jgi:hypothetical protein
MRELSYSQRVLRQTKLMELMMKRLGVNAAFAAQMDGGLAWHEARTKCIFCPNVERCCAWLEGCEPLPGPADFCPISGFFQDCSLEILKSRAVVPTSRIRACSPASFHNPYQPQHK